ncbi:hypothetical protein E2562_032501 [Oryza meyeriana var. granulata]|uniref:F-box associated beta-propeller type 1 domain-containing protein n=1 Tax=Oryza meyeriana var. granulata TaxID=110450 RepID=A0A6G1E5F3_9ORYZ|nr:hypothetical protein E2562_032501 [Oryza meyeriana var. granulata]
MASPSPAPRSSRNRAMETADPLDEETLLRSCKAWKSLLADNEMCLAKNVSRSGRRGGSKDALLVGTVYRPDDDCTDVTLMDASSGEVVRRMDGLSRPGFHVCAGGDMLCVVSARHGVLRLVDAATGDMTDLSPGGTAAKGNVHSGYTLGQVAATGEYKVLHVYAVRQGDRFQYQQSSEVLTIAGDGDVSGCRWRPTKSPPMRVEYTISRGSATVDGVVYFLSAATANAPGPGRRDHAECDSIAAFDLATEQWRPTLLQGPLSAQHSHHIQYRIHLSLAALDGRLVTVHHNYPANTIDLWALTSPNTTTTTWTKTHSLPLNTILRRGRLVTYSATPMVKLEPGRRGGRQQRRKPTTTYRPTAAEVEAAIVAHDRESVAQPLAVLEDGRMALWTRGRKGAVRLHDPRTGACEEVAQLEHFVGFYTGPLSA